MRKHTAHMYKLFTGILIANSHMKSANYNYLHFLEACGFTTKLLDAHTLYREFPESCLFEWIRVMGLWEVLVFQRGKRRRATSFRNDCTILKRMH